MAKSKRKCKKGLKANGRLAKGYIWPGGGKCPVKIGKKAGRDRFVGKGRSSIKVSSKEKRELTQLRKWLDSKRTDEAGEVTLPREYETGRRYSEGYERWKEQNRIAGMDRPGAFAQYYRENVAGLEGPYMSAKMSKLARRGAKKRRAHNWATGEGKKSDSHKAKKTNVNPTSYKIPGLGSSKMKRRKKFSY